MPDLQDVAQKVEELYSSTDPESISKNQRYLQQLQRSDQGYCMAQRLLEHPSLNCKYFGALTYTVVIQTNAFTQENYSGLLRDMLAKIRLLASIGGADFVVRKLLSNISVLYLKTHEFFSPVPEVLRMVRPEWHGDATSPSAYEDLSRDQWSLLLVFLTVLVEDVSKLNDVRAPVHRGLQKDVFPCIQAVYGFLLANHRPDVVPRALDCLAAWMAYVPEAAGDTRYDDIAVFSQFLLRNLFVSHNSPACLAIFNDILDANATLVPPNDKKVLFESVCGAWGEQYVETSSNLSSFVDLFLTILQITCIHLAKNIMEADSMAVLAFALRLSEFPGVPCIEDDVSERMLLFWEDFAAVFEDSPEKFAELGDEFSRRKNDIFHQVAQVYWKKVHVPDNETYRDIFHEFNAYRSNVSDFFIVLYSLLKLELYETMVGSLAGDIATLGDISGADATLYLLFKINDDSVYFESQAAPLAALTQRLFESAFVASYSATLETHYMQDTTPFYVSTFVKYLASTEFFLKTEPGRRFLRPVFAILLPIVHTVPSKEHVSQTSTALLASKSITRICDECSPYLVEMLGELEATVVQMLKNPAYDSLVRSRMFNAYSVVAQNITDLEQYAGVLHGMISAIAAAAAETLKADVPLGEDDDEYVISLLSCLVNIAKGSVHSDDAVEDMGQEEKDRYTAFWAADPAQIKPLLASIIDEFSFKYPRSGRALVIEKCTQIIKVGLSESLGGPFEMAIPTISEYCVSVMQVLAETQEPSASHSLAIPHIYSLMQCLINTSSHIMDPVLVQSLIHSTIVDKLAVVRHDPDLVKAAVDVCCTIVDRRPALLLFSPDLSKLLEFSLACFHASEASTVKAASKFWYCLLLMKKGSQDDTHYFASLLVDHGVGAVLTENLVSGFVQAPRSNLEHFYQTFRALLGKYPMQVKPWLLKALEGRIVDKLGEKNASMFVHKLLVTRGRRTANEVLRVFWLESNGMVDYNSR